MNKAEMLIIADLLDLAGEEFSNHTCNDYEIPDTEENREIIKEAMSDEIEETGIWVTKKGNLYTYDSVLMSYFAEKSRKEFLNQKERKS